MWKALMYRRPRAYGSGSAWNHNPEGTPKLTLNLKRRRRGDYRQYQGSLRGLPC